MPHELLEREDIVKKTIYNTQDPIANALYAIEELLKFSNTTIKWYNQDKAVNKA